MTAEFQFHSTLPFSDALQIQADRLSDLVHARSQGLVLGFESSPVVTLGVRGNVAVDLKVTASELGEKGFQLLKLTRGGQATLHMPGQLVIFPILPMRDFGVRNWMNLLGEVTVAALRELSVPAEWNHENPGVYTDRGKIAAMGLKIDRGISTHGLAINVSNDLSCFGMIRPCGRCDAAVDRVLGYAEADVRQVWDIWTEKFRQSV